MFEKDILDSFMKDDFKQFFIDYEKTFLSYKPFSSKIIQREMNKL